MPESNLQANFHSSIDNLQSCLSGVFKRIEMLNKMATKGITKKDLMTEIKKLTAEMRGEIYKLNNKEFDN